ncbi:MAG: T9SS type A sorting domain-containing protein [Bacteroidota bacterium]
MKYLTVPFMLVVIVAGVSLAQITISKSQIQAVFTPGSTIRGFAAAETTASVNVGLKGGPNVYDFTSIPFTAQLLTNVYSVSQVPYLIGHYPDSGITIGQSASFIENNFILLFAGDTLKTIGQVFVSADSQKYRHSIPPELRAIFPANYGDTLTYTQTPGAGVETTYVGGVPVRVTTGWNSSGTATFDGFGTLRLGSYELQCLRIKTIEVSPYTHQGFTYLTREGLIFSVDATSEQPDTGLIQITGMFYFVGGPLVSVPNQNNLPERFALLQNYPNPFNPATTIRFSLPTSSFVTLKIFDLLGQEVGILINEKLSAGEHATKWNAVGYPSGIYFYRLQASGFMESRKLILLK